MLRKRKHRTVQHRIRHRRIAAAAAAAAGRGEGGCVTTSGGEWRAGQSASPLTKGRGGAGEWRAE